MNINEQETANLIKADVYNTSRPTHIVLEELVPVIKYLLERVEDLDAEENK
jgi:hypothetical protein